MSKFKSVFKAVSSILGAGPKQPAIKFPDPVIPAAPAPGTRTDTGATITIGNNADDLRQRVSARKKKSAGVDVLGGLGGGSGINI